MTASVVYFCNSEKENILKMTTTVADHVTDLWHVFFLDKKALVLEDGQPRCKALRQ